MFYFSHDDRDPIKGTYTETYINVESSVALVRETYPDGYQFFTKRSLDESGQVREHSITKDEFIAIKNERA